MVCQVRAKLRLRIVCKKVVAKVKASQPEGWSRVSMEEYKARLIAFSRAETNGERELIRHMMTQAKVAPSIACAFAENGQDFDLIEEATVAHGEIEEAKDRQLGRVADEVSNHEIQAAVQAVSTRQEQMERRIMELAAQVSNLAMVISSSDAPSGKTCSASTEATKTTKASGSASVVDGEDAASNAVGVTMRFCQTPITAAQLGNLWRTGEDAVGFLFS
jgi:hypothetical protein